MNLEDIWFEQDGATSHIPNKIIQLVKEKINRRVISVNGYVNWLPRSPDLAPIGLELREKSGLLKISELRDTIIQLLKNKIKLKLQFNRPLIWVECK